MKSWLLLWTRLAWSRRGKWRRRDTVQRSWCGQGTGHIETTLPATIYCTYRPILEDPGVDHVAEGKLGQEDNRWQRVMGEGELFLFLFSLSTIVYPMPHFPVCPTIHPWASVLQLAHITPCVIPACLLAERQEFTHWNILPVFSCLVSNWCLTQSPFQAVAPHSARRTVLL